MLNGTLSYELWISYSNHRYVRVGVYPNPIELEKEFDRYCHIHTVRGDKVKAITRFVSAKD